MLTPPQKKSLQTPMILFYFLTWELFQKQNQRVIFPSYCWAAHGITPTISFLPQQKTFWHEVQSSQASFPSWPMEEPTLVPISGQGSDQSLVALAVPNSPVYIRQ